VSRGRGRRRRRVRLETDGNRFTDWPGVVACSACRRLSADGHGSLAGGRAEFISGRG
jgi:hypothetical protein